MAGSSSIAFTRHPYALTILEMEERQTQLVGVLEKLLKIGFGLGGFVNLGMGAWMLASPRGWFDLVPGPASDFGPYNAHFLRDIAGWYLASGVLMLFALSNVRRYGGVTLIVLVIANGLHAADHVVSTLIGAVPAGHWVADVPVLVVPVIVIAVMLWLWWRLQAELHGQPSLPGRSEDDEETLSVLSD